MTRVSMFGYLGGQAKLSGQLRGGGGGGDHITITPILTSGEKIADYEINGEAGELYCLKSYNDLDDKPIIPPAPTGMVGASAGSNGSAGYVPQPLAGDEGKILYGDGTWKTIPSNIIDYSTSEQNTGQKWIDGKDIYQRTFHFTPDFILSSANTWYNSTIDATMMDTILLCRGYTTDTVYDGLTCAKYNPGTGYIIQFLAYRYTALTYVTIAYTKN